jgi:hypothetical protein
MAKKGILPGSESLFRCVILDELLYCKPAGEWPRKGGLETVNLQSFEVIVRHQAGAVQVGRILVISRNRSSRLE